MNPRRVLLLPGLDGSGPRHWQSLWEMNQPFVTVVHAIVERVNISNFKAPRFDVWKQELDKDLRSDPRPTWLVGHSLGCILACSTTASNVRGALLVAPANPSRHGFPAHARGFELPEMVLQFPSVLVASENDPYADPSWSLSLSTKLGSRMENAGRAGHINAESSLGDWIHGQNLLIGLIEHGNDGK
jgi:predicted alpha/beta hydrolase family esterase